MHKKPYTYTESNQELIKRIELEKEFAKYIAKDLMSQRYGITTYCSTDKYDSTLIQKELCDWQNLKKPVQTRSYHNIRWERLSYHDPQPDWIQWGEIAGCADACPSPTTYLPPTGSPFYLRLDIPLSVILNQQFFPNSTGSAELYAFASGDGEAPWGTVGQASLPTNASSVNLGGANIININGQLIYRFHVYFSDGDTDAITVGAEQDDNIKFILVDGAQQYNIYFANSDWPTVDGTDAAFQVAPAEENIDGCFSCWNQITIQTNPTYEMFCTSGFQDCWFCGMVPTNPADPFFQSGAVHFKCENDQECIYLLVQDQYYNPIPNYEIILDGELYGTTDENGLLLFSIPQASTNNFHTINDCEFCFYTTGSCNQQKITITVNTDAAKVSCDVRTIQLTCKTGELVDATVVTPETPTDVNTSWICENDGTTFNGCVEIIDSQGTIGYATETECLENCQPPPPVYRCVPFGPNNPCQCLETVGEENGINIFGSIEDCENCTDCCCNPPDPEPLTVWKCEKDLTIPIPQGGSDCVQEFCTQIEVNPNADVDGTPNLFYTETECINASCGCEEERAPVTHYCESGNCIEVGQDGFIPPWILSNVQFTSLEDCESLCGTFRQEAWMNISPNFSEFADAGFVWNSANFPYTCCEMVGMVNELAENQYATEAECNAYTNCGSGIGDEADFPYTCIECFLPETGAYQWTPEVYLPLDAGIGSGGDTLQGVLQNENFLSQYVIYDGGTGYSTTVADPQRLLDENTKFVIIPVSFSDTGEPFQSADSDGNPYTFTVNNTFGSSFRVMTNSSVATGLTLDLELTSLVNTLHFKNSVDPTKLSDNYWDMANSSCNTESQSSSVHGVRTGGIQAYYQPQILQFQEISAWQGDTGTSWKISAIENPANLYYGQFGASPLSGWNNPCLFNLGGHFMWLAFTYDQSIVDNNTTCVIQVDYVDIDAECWEGGCPLNANNAIDCAANSPYIFTINPDTTY